MMTRFASSGVTIRLDEVLGSYSGGAWWVGVNTRRQGESIKAL
jgi:hypothetical protein